MSDWNELLARLRAIGLPSARDAADTLTALHAENQRLREALEHIEQLAGAVGVDLQGRVEGGKVAAVLNCRSIARAALRSTETSHDN